MSERTQWRSREEAKMLLLAWKLELDAFCALGFYWCLRWYKTIGLYWVKFDGWDWEGLGFGDNHQFVILAFCFSLFFSMRRIGNSNFKPLSSFLLFDYFCLLVLKVMCTWGVPHFGIRNSTTFFSLLFFTFVNWNNVHFVQLQYNFHPVFCVSYPIS